MFVHRAPSLGLPAGCRRSREDGSANEPARTSAPLSHALVRRLDAVAGLADPAEVERLRDAMTRLEREHPKLHESVVLMDASGTELRTVAPVLGVSIGMVSQRRDEHGEPAPR